MESKFRHRLFASAAALLASAALAAAPSEPPSALIAQGDSQWAAGKLDAAQQAFEQAVVAQPRSVAAIMKLAGLQLSRLNFVASVENYKRAIALDAQNAKAWLGLGFSYLHSGRRDLSRAAFEEAIRIDPGNKEKLAPVMAKLDTP